MFKSEQGKKEILHLYDAKLDSLKIEYEYLTVQTSFGKTNIIDTGDPANPPIIIDHGSNDCAPIALETYANLHNTFGVYAVRMKMSQMSTHKYVILIYERLFTNMNT